MSLLLRRRALLSKLRGFLRAISGIPPLSLVRCVDDTSLVSCTIEGNSTCSNLNPSQDNHAHVESVGERTKNLFDASKIKSSSIKVSEDCRTITMPLVSTGNGYSSTGAKLSELCPDLHEGDTVVLNFSTTSEHNNKIYLNNGKIYWITGSSSIITEEMLDSTVVLYGNNWDKGEDWQVTITDFQIEYGTTRTEYEPYGYKIPLIATGKNLLNIEPMTSAENWKENAIVAENTGYSNYPFTGLLPNTTYTISMKENGFLGVENNIYVSIVNSVSKWQHATSLCHAAGSAQYCATKRTITTNEDGLLYLSFYTPTDEKLALFFSNCPEMMLEVGSTATEYEPYQEPKEINVYLDEPLRKMGDYADYIDLESKKVVRKVNCYTLSKDPTVWTEDSTTTAGGKVFRTDVTVTPLIGASIADTFMNHFSLTNKSSTSSFVPCEYRFAYSSDSIASSRIYVSPTQTTIEEFMVWLTSNESKVYYPIPDNEQNVETPQLPTFANQTTIYTVHTTVLPSNMEVTYYSRESQ